MSKIDLIKEDQHYYTATTNPVIREFPPLCYLSLKGMGAPATQDYIKGVQILYAFAYSIKKLCKEKQRDFAIPKLESFWWVDLDQPALEVSRDAWQWKLLIRMPDYITPEIVQKAKLDVTKKKKEIKLIEKINFEIIHQGTCIQILHIGPYEKEPATIEKIKEKMRQNNWAENGYHHEIYLSDPRKTSPEKIKTILRQPIKSISG